MCRSYPPEFRGEGHIPVRDKYIQEIIIRKTMVLSSLEKLVVVSRIIMHKILQWLVYMTAII
jgi:hypothetical protein